MLRSRSGTPADLLVVGLGNPGPEYAHTRHNVGADVVEVLATRYGERLKGGRYNSLIAEAKVGPQRMGLAFPLTYMNESGMAVAPLVRRFGIEDLHRLVVVHDEFDLPVGRVKIKVGGGLAGHNGLRSIKAHLKTDDFVRIRIGIGKPVDKRQGANKVLGPFSKRERQEIDVILEEMADACELIMREGPEVAMNRYNTIAAGDS